MKRRDLLAGMSALAGASALPWKPAGAQGFPASLALQDVWAAWRAGHMDPTGRVIDRIQQNASHSEGQAYGMLIAATLGDQAAFTRLETWTQVNLAIRPDNLMAWRWLPDEPVPVPDLNNASDGDLFRAWALVRAARRFDDPSYLDTAFAIASDLVNTCLVEGPGGLPLLLPAVDGFATEAGHVINPCYSMPLAMAELATAFDLPVLAQAARGAIELNARLAEFAAVPDWIEVAGEELRPAPGFAFVSGYEAIRVPLCLIWSGLRDHPAVLRYAEVQNRTTGRETAIEIDPATGEILSTSKDAGYGSVAALSICAANGSLGSAIQPFSPRDPYYPATLHVFAMLAQAEAAPMCIPL